MVPSFISPVPRPNFAISGWGSPREGHSHEGIDFPVPVGTPIAAAAGGTVVTSVDSTGASGNYVAVRHEGGFITRYMHLSKRLVAKGDVVHQGQTLALSGNTGIDSSGPHLHYDTKMVPALLANYIERFGTPQGGFGRNLYEGIGVPSEPLVPVDKYAPGVIAGATKYGIPLHRAGLELGGLIIVGLGLWWLLRRRR